MKWDVLVMPVGRSIGWRVAMETQVSVVFIWDPLVVMVTKGCHEHW